MKKIGRLIQSIVMTLLALIVAANCMLLVKRLVYKEELPTLFGYAIVTVLSGSMEPEFFPGDLLVVHAQEPYRVGEIVTYQAQGTFVTHRIVGLDGENFLTQGDANNAPDGQPVSQSQIHGKVRLIIPGVGNIVLFFKSTLGTLVLIILFLALVEFSFWREKKNRGDASS